MISFRLGVCGQEFQRSDSVSFSVHPIGNHVTSACSSIGDINFELLVKKCLPGFSTVKLLGFFPL